MSDGIIIIAARFVLFEPLKSGKRSVKHLSSEMQVTAVELHVSENCLKQGCKITRPHPTHGWGENFSKKSWVEVGWGEL